MPAFSASFTPFSAVAGGVLIGASAALLLLGFGRIAGITGVLDGAFRARAGDRGWRWWFLGGLVGGGALLRWGYPAAFSGQSGQGQLPLMVAGLLVGFGTRLGNGCTSGHGVCGIGRLSKRSFVATAVFIASGAVTVFFTRGLSPGLSGVLP